MRGTRFCVLIAVMLAAGPASGQSAQSNLTVIQPAGTAVSLPLSQISSPAVPTVPATIPLRPRSHAHDGALAPGQPDEALQIEPGDLLELEDGGKPRFPGVGANGSAPPDPNLAIGPNHIVQMVNTEVAVYSKSGTIFAGYPKPIGSLFTALGGGCTGAWGDPIVQYDRAADRWLISQLGTFSVPGVECIAVSQTNDPTGAYNLYSYSFSSFNAFNDYPKISVWPTSSNSAYLGTYNLFDSVGNFVGSALCAYDRAAMLSGANALSICATISNDGGYLPSDLDGSTLPPAGAPGTFLTFETLSSLRFYQIFPNFANPSSSTLGAPTDIAVASFSEACGGGTCIPQSGTSQQLDSLGDRPMYRLAYRNFGDHDALVVNHSVTAGASVGIRWYELRSPLNEAFTLYQQGTFAPDATYRWMGSAAMDSAGDIAVGYSASSSSIFPAIRYTGRTPTDALGTMRTETSLLEGSGSQTGSLSRWGDYTALRIDPSDDCTFWYTNQYQPGNGSFNWATFIGSFKFTNCGAAPAPDFSISASPSSQTVTSGNGTSYTATVSPLNGFTGSVSLTASGVPSGANATFSTNPITGGSGSSTMSVTTSSTTPAGTYTLTITAISGSFTHTAMVTLIVNPASSGDFSLSASPSSQAVTQGNSTSYTMTVTALGPFTGNVNLSVTAGLPSGAGASFSPNPVTGGSGSSTMTVNTSGSTPAGTYTLTITGISGSLTHTAMVTLIVNPASSGDFSLSASPTSQAVTQGNSTSYTTTVTALGPFTGNVNLSVTAGLPSGAGASFSPNPVTGGSGSSTMRITTNTSTPTGSYTVTITGTSGSLTHSTTVTLVVNSFSISAMPSSQTVTLGNSTSYTVTVTPINGFNGTVALRVRGLPANSTASFNPSSVVGQGASTMTVTTNASTSTGTFSLRIRGTYGSVTHSTTVQLVVQ